MTEDPVPAVSNPFRRFARLLNEGRIQGARAWPVPAGFILSFAVAGGLGVAVSTPDVWSRVELHDGLIVALIAAPALAVAIGFCRVFLDERLGSHVVVEETRSDSERLAERIDQVNRSIADAGVLIEDLKEELERQQEERNLILEEVEESRGWLAVNEPVVQQYRRAQEKAVLARDQEQSRQNRRYFVAGILLSIPIGILINLIT